MVVKIRLSRFGKKRQPIYNIVVSQARTARDSRPMEVLGTYDPKPRVPLATSTDTDIDTDNISANYDSNSAPAQVVDQTTGLPRPVARQPLPKKYKDIRLDQSRTKYWLGVGAQPSEPVERLLSLIGLMERRPGAGGTGPRQPISFPRPPSAKIDVARTATNL